MAFVPAAKRFIKLTTYIRHTPDEKKSAPNPRRSDVMLVLVKSILGGDSLPGRTQDDMQQFDKLLQGDFPMTKSHHICAVGNGDIPSVLLLQVHRSDRLRRKIHIN